MKTLVASLADNKSALGRRYAEWAVSAPDAGIGRRRGRDGPGRARPRALDLPGVEAARRGRQRGRLRRRQAARAARRRAAGLERVHRREPSGRRRADDLRRLVRGQQPRPDGRSARRRSSRRRARTARTARRGRGACCAASGTATRSSPACSRPGSTPGRWFGPDDDPEYLAGARSRRGHARPARTSAKLMRAWLTGLLAREDVEIELPELDLGGLGPRAPPVERMTCPFCDSADVERVAQWGGQIITAQWRCQACNSYFEAVREDFDDDATTDGGDRWGTGDRGRDLPAPGR